MASENKDSVRIVLFSPEDPRRFLVVTEPDDPTNIKLLGGQLENNELPDIAAERELMEEGGVSAETVALQAAGSLVNRHDASKLRYIYAGVAPSEDFPTTSQIAKQSWETKDSLPEGKNKVHILEAVELAQRTALKAAKEEFRRTMLANDTFFKIVAKKLGSAYKTPMDLPDFELEPTYERNEDGTVRLGMVITRSVTTTEEALPAFSFSLGLHDHLPLADIDMESGDTKLTPDFKEGLSELDIEPMGSESLELLELWKSSWNALTRRVKGVATLDPLTHTVALKSDIDGRNTLT